MTDQQIINTVDPIAKQYGVPTYIWETVAEVESGLNPRAIGDHGTSFGLFQLHQGGQLGNLTPEQAYDPATNAKTAMPAIAAAWKKLSKGIGGPSVINGTQYPGNFNWWYDFATLSGHPGADPTAASNEAKQLQSEATTLSSHPLPKAGDNNTNTADRQPYNTTGGTFDPFGLGTWITNTKNQLQSGAIKTGIFALAVVLVIVGLYAMSRGDA